MSTALTPERSALVRRGLLLNYFTIGYNAVEAIISVAACLVSGSVALVSFGLCAFGQADRVASAGSHLTTSGFPVDAQDDRALMALYIAKFLRSRGCQSDGLPIGCP